MNIMTGTTEKNNSTQEDSIGVISCESTESKKSKVDLRLPSLWR